jgi:GAF domain-containing protein
MRSRAARLTLLILFVVALGVTAFLFWNGESLVSAETAALNAFETKAQAVSRAILDVRMAQQAYVASGQTGDLWTGKVASGIPAILSGVQELKTAATTAQTAAELDKIPPIFEQYSQLDRRAREYTRNGQNLLASDLIFSDGRELSDRATARIAAALETERAAREAAVGVFRSRQLFALIAAAAAAILVILLLYPQSDEGFAPKAFAGGSRSAEAAGAALTPSIAGLSKNRIEDEAVDFGAEGWTPPHRVGAAQATEQSAEGAVAPGEIDEDAEMPALPALTSATAPISMDFSNLASICTDLARVIDTHQLPGLLERASSVLDASGIILWIADPDARELNPIMAQGYPAQLLNRLGALPRDAENATAAAFRTSLLQTVKGDARTNGAIAAPLVTSSGCVGVMAAEVRNEAEQKDAKLAAAAIMAAQLATLVGPPPSHRGKAEAAGA